MSIADLRCSGSSGMATLFQSLTAFTQAFSWEQRCHYSVPQRTVQASKCIKRYSYSKVSNSYEAKDSSTKVNEKAREKLLIDCGPDQQCVFGGVAALGKFDALHVGHRELAIQASKIGAPFLLSFAGIAEVLGWERRLPIVANCDRKRVLALWAPLCGGMIPQEYQVQFSLVRHLSPRQFVQKLSNELGVKGVVAGANYRFGYKAAGDASDLVQLCGEYGLKAAIVDPVMDKTNRLVKEQKIVGVNAREKGQVSSTLIRSALAAGSMRRVNELLGRKHRLVLCSDDCNVSATSLVSNTSNALNQFPFNGQYACTLVVGSMDKVDSHSFSNECIIGSAHLDITSDQLTVTLDEGTSIEKLNRTYYIGLDFEDCDATDAYTL